MRNVIKFISIALVSVLLCSCAGTKVMVIDAQHTETFVFKGKAFTPATDGVYMPLAQYQRYRRAVADAIQRESRP